jgi:SAM-dependent methyltransferase
MVRFGNLRRLRPISHRMGLDRGQPVDRHYLEEFLAEHAHRIRGTVLEIGEKRYTLAGGDRVDRFEILHVADQLPGVTIVGDLTDPELFEENTFDCMVITQVFQFVYDLRAAVENCHRFLAPGGSLLTTLPGISQISAPDMERWGQYWSLTSRSAERLFGEVFEGGEVEVLAYGNVLAAIAFLHGIAAGELRTDELDHRDPDYQLLVAIRATKAS